MAHEYNGWICGCTWLHPTCVCPECSQAESLSLMRRENRFYSLGMFSRLDQIGISIESELSGVVRAMDSNMRSVASMLEWVPALYGEILRQNDLLLDIRQILSSPTETAYKERFLRAEQLRLKYLDEKFVVKALNEAELERLYQDTYDQYWSIVEKLQVVEYPVWMAIAELSLAADDFTKAQEALRTSVSHAPYEPDFHYKSYSYRMLGRLEFTFANYEAARDLLVEAVGISPKYAEGWYDLAQYFCQTGEFAKAGEALTKAMTLNPVYWYSARKEGNFRWKR